MPDSVRGNLTAVLRYDLKNSFGIGNSEFILPVMDDVEWNNNYNRYEFWQGKGFLRAEDMEENSATITLYQGKDNVLESVRLTTGTTGSGGESSRDLYLPGFYCLAKLNVKLLGIQNPDTIAKIKVDDDYFDLSAGQRFLDNRCSVSKIIKNGASQEVSINCREDGKSTLLKFSISPKVSLLINDSLKEKISVGDYLYDSADGKSFVYLTNLDKDGKGKIFASLGTSTTKVSNIYSFTTYNTLRVSDRVKIAFGEKNKIFEGGRVEIVDFSEDVIDQSFFGLSDYGNEIERYSVDFEDNFAKSISDYRQVSSQFKEEKIYPAIEDSETYGEKSLFAGAVQLADPTRKYQTRNDLLNELITNYPTSTYSDQAKEILNNELSSSDTSVRGVLINGRVRLISFKGIEEPSTDEYSAQVVVDKQSTGEREIVTLTKNVPSVLFSSSDKGGESIELKKLDDTRATVDYSFRDERGNIRSGTTIVNLRESRTVLGYRVYLNEVNLKKVAKVAVSPNFQDSFSQTQFSYQVDIEKRAVQLTPDKIDSKIKTLNETIKTLEDVNENLGSVVKGFKAACLATTGYLTVKNLFENWNSGKAIARQDVMRGDGGWFNFCQLESEKTGVSIDTCLRDHNSDIERDVNNYATIIENQNNVIKVVNEKYKDDKTDAAVKEYRQQVISKVRAYNGEIKDSGGNNVNKDALISALEQETSIVNLRDFERNLIISDADLSSNIKEANKKVFADSASDMLKVYEADKQRDSIESQLRADGLNGITTEVYGSKDAIQGIYGGGVAGEGNKYRINSGELVQSISFNGKDLILVLIPVTSTSNVYKIKDIYDKNLVKKLDVNKLEDKKVIDSVNERFTSFRKYDEFSYKNSYKSPQVRYYETAPYKGLPSVVPFDLNDGWYAATRQILATPASGFLGGGSKATAPFDESGRVNSLWICNVGKNGKEEFSSGFGDDICEQVNVGIGQEAAFPGLDSGKAKSIVTQGVKAIEEASRQYKSGVKSVRINGRNIPVGNPAANIPQVQCQDFMSPEDCYTMFNVCDPVVCPSSRCDLGGKYQVDNVIQSGIIGSVALCLPNANEGIAVPICLSGVHAGIDGLNSVLKNYRACLQEQLATGKTTALCDELHSIYMCEFFWREATPAAGYAIPQLLGAVGGNKGGGGEYMNSQAAWQNAQGTVDYITNYYAADSYTAFKARSTDEVGSALCKNFASALYPSGGDLLGNLIEPDSPSQYHAWFDEIPFTTATVPPTSQYKVFYHIYAGKDIGATYSVYLKSPEGSSFFQTAPTFLVDTGYIPKGEIDSQTKDFTATSGYKKLCVRVNNEEECDFKQVTTEFALDYLNDKYLQEQATNKNIRTNSECVSGTPSLYSLATPNIQEGVSETFNPELYNYGIVRICATDNPGAGTDSRANTKQSRWIEVGSCDDGKGKVKCWLDTRSVRENIQGEGIRNSTLSDVTDNYLDVLKGEAGFLTEAGGNEAIGKIRNQGDSTEKIRMINEVYDKVIFTNQKAELIFLRAEAYAQIALDKFRFLQEKVAEKKVPTYSAPDNMKLKKTIPANDWPSCQTICDTAAQEFGKINGCDRSTCENNDYGKECIFESGYCMEKEVEVVSTGTTSSGSGGIPIGEFYNVKYDYFDRSWDSNWNYYIANSISDNSPLLITDLNDAKLVCPRFNTLSNKEKRIFWAYFFQALAGSESNLNLVSYNPSDAGGGSWGLLQVSYPDKDRYGCNFNANADNTKDTKDLSRTIFDPKNNLECGVKIMEKRLALIGNNFFTNGNAASGYWRDLDRRSAGYKERFSKHMASNLPSFCTIDLSVTNEVSSGSEVAPEDEDYFVADSTGESGGSVSGASPETAYLNVGDSFFSNKIPESEVVHLTFRGAFFGILGFDDEVYVKWVFGQGVQMIIRPNGDKIFESDVGYLEGIDNSQDGREIIIYSKEHAVFTQDKNEKLKKIDPRNLEEIKNLFNSKTPAEFSLRIWDLSKGNYVSVNGLEDIDSLPKVNKAIYGSEVAPEDEDYFVADFVVK